jgi:hypothetical protein
MAISKSALLYEDVWGKLRVRAYDVTLDTSYPAGGYGASLGFSAIAFGFGPTGVIFGVLPIAYDADGPLVVLGFDRVNKKLMAFRAGTVTPGGTISGNVTVVGGAIGEAVGINPDSNAGVLSKAAATNRTIPIATFLGAAPTFTGTATGQGSLAEVTAAVSLAAVTVRCLVMAITG